MKTPPVMTPNKDILAGWLRAMISVMPRGGKAQAAAQLSITPSGLSKLLNVPERSFDEKTLRAFSWMMTSKAERFPESEFPVISSTQVGDFLIEMRRDNATGAEFPVWRR